MLIAVPAGGALADDDGGGEDGELHCTMGAVGLALLAGTLLTGFLTSGRFGRIKGLKTLNIHFFGTVLMSSFMTGEFVYGLLTGSLNFLRSLHGTVGLLVPVFAWATTFSSPCMAGKVIDRKTASRAHAVLAVVLILLSVWQVWYGYSFMDD